MAARNQNKAIADKTLRPKRSASGAQQSAKRAGMTTTVEPANPVDWYALLPDADLPDMASFAPHIEANERNPLRQKLASDAAGPILPDIPEQAPEPTLLTLDAVAAKLGMSTKSVRRRIKVGVIRTVPLGGRLVRISSDELRRLTSGELLPLTSKDPDVV